ncbi:hypothetical protein FGO68_gene2146 [Halteria grandinella]|uniref:Uncharacterized protein n=1 Tax=Halteria grandinella TaxID=5974 RepID=A0A8J8T3S4_HALGN|nr:hypothetical protein FGO68_gene2146 [Halteria grandinella]
MEAYQKREMELQQEKQKQMEGEESKVAEIQRQIDLAKTVFNKSSVPHNIITWDRFEESKRNSNVSSQTVKAPDQKASQFLNRNIHYHKKTISEYCDASQPNAVHEKTEFVQAITENPHIFKKLTGLCTFYKDAETKHRHCVLKPPLRTQKSPKRISLGVSALRDASNSISGRLATLPVAATTQKINVSPQRVSVGRVQVQKPQQNKQ